MRARVDPIAAIASAGLSAAMIAALAAAGMIAAERAHDAGQVMTVLDLAAPLGSEDAADDAARTEPDDVRTSPPQTRPVETPPPPPMPLTATQPAQLQTTTPAAQPAMVPASPAPSTSATAAPAPAAPAPHMTPARHGAREGLAADASGTSRAYAARVRSWLLAHLVYPRHARMRRIEGVVRVRFVLDRAGRLIEGAMVGSSGQAMLDAEGEAMLVRASPYPSAPPDVTGERIVFTTAIQFSLLR